MDIFWRLGKGKDEKKISYSLFYVYFLSKKDKKIEL
jgi:hypothetical protein